MWNREKAARGEGPPRPSGLRKTRQAGNWVGFSQRVRVWGKTARAVSRSQAAGVCAFLCFFLMGPWKKLGERHGKEGGGGPSKSRHYL